MRQGRPQAVLCELGDGAVNMGAWHESLNLAAVWRLPVVFLVMNNEYGMGTSVERASAVTELYRRADAYDMPAERVDGDDLLAVAQAAATMLSAAREERQPAVLELVTYRYRGHSVADAGLAYRTRGEIDEHLRHDPIFRVARAARRTRASPTASSTRCSSAAEERVAAAVEVALASPPPRGLDARHRHVRARQRGAVRADAARRAVRRARARLRRRARRVSATAPPLGHPRGAGARRR